VGVRSSVLRHLLASVIVVLAASVFVVPSGSAGASCIGPTLDPVDPVARGGTLTVSAIGFGTNCYDTGPPPAGQGALGRPVTGIELAVVQHGNEVVVARGAANEKYEFEVDVTVPAELGPGPAQLIARWKGAGSGRVVLPIEVTADPATSSSVPVTVASFGPDEAAAPTLGSRSPSQDTDAEDGPNLVVRGVPLVLLAGLVVAFVLRRKRRAARAIDESGSPLPSPPSTERR